MPPGRSVRYDRADRGRDRRFRSLKTELQRPQAEFAAHTPHPQMDTGVVPKWKQRKSELVETIRHPEHDLDEVKQERKAS